VFILYALVIGLVVGSVLGGRWHALGAIEFRWAPLILVGFLAQVVLFSEAVAERVGDAGPLLYVVSTLMVGAAVVRNLRIPGIPLIVLGAVSNMAAILANGGFMPAAPDALASIGKSAPTIYSNSAVVAQPALEFLTDRFALPHWLPLANVFSVGDILIGAGVFALIVTTMLGGRRNDPPSGNAGPRIDPHPAPGAGTH
jgi:uncharacterized protein DUF5317